MKHVSTIAGRPVDRRRRAAIFPPALGPERWLVTLLDSTEKWAIGTKSRQSQLGHEGRPRSFADKLDGQGPVLSPSQESLQGFPDQRPSSGRYEEANSGIFIRCERPRRSDSKVCYEVNIFRTAADPSLGTGAIVDVAKVDPMPKAACKLDTRYEITAQVRTFVFVLNVRRPSTRRLKTPPAATSRFNTFPAWSSPQGADLMVL